MLLFRAGHPQQVLLESFAREAQLSPLAVDGPALSRLERRAFEHPCERLLVVGTAADRGAWTRAVLALPSERRPRSLVWLPEDASAAALREALACRVVETSFVEWDHNLASAPELVLELAWGTAVPLVEAAQTAAGAGGLWDKAKGSVDSLRALGREATSESAWSLGEAPAQPSRAGFLTMDEARVPRALRASVHAAQGRWSAQGESLNPANWAAIVVGAGDRARLQGAGSAWLNGRRVRLSAVDRVYLVGLPAIAFGRVGALL